MKRILFSVVAPRAKDVQLVGDFTEWLESPIMMDRMKPRSRTFAAAVRLDPGTYEYKFIVDGEWMEDPNADQSVPNEYGTRNSVKVVEKAR
jgi:1,4-alpha-glucan branching enzyme